ncbi:putative phage abortive infection protein [Vibrio navarrensis]|uniref:Uncharacterized protein n=1 Tax=Vibrio navarrensis TaxID=29495 RepID=A0AAJ4IDJ7_9VIBR|nr:hypothetical protein I3X05_06665 [Vibrio navarrensis]
MRTRFRDFKYKGFTGTVERLEDGSFSGKVNDLNEGFSYLAPSHSELEVQFKNRVDYFYELCTMLGVEPEIIGRVKSRSWPYFLLFLIAVFVMAGLLWFYAHEFPLSEVASQSNSKLDWFDKSGSFFNNYSAPLLSFLSFMGLLFTIYQQNRSHQLSLKELALTREELELTRKEIEKTTIANEEQAEALRQQVVEAQSAAAEQKALAQEQRKATQIQQFETSFYALLAEHNQALTELINAAKGNNDDIVNISSIAFYSMHDCLKEIQDNAQLCRYFRMLYQILKFVVTNHVSNLNRDFSNEYLQSDVSEEEKRYASLIRAMLPQNVLGILAVNCCAGYEPEHSYHKYFLVLQRYSFLEHLNVDTALTYREMDYRHPNAMAIVIQSYSPTAFGTSESLVKLEKKFRKYLEYENPESDHIIFVLGKGKKGSVYEKMTKIEHAWNCPFWAVLN